MTHRYTNLDVQKNSGLYRNNTDGLAVVVAEFLHEKVYFCGRKRYFSFSTEIIFKTLITQTD